MYPLRRKPTKLFSKVVILLIWIFAMAFALPMGLVHEFTYVGEANGGQKPFCTFNFGTNETESFNMELFKYYTYVFVVFHCVFFKVYKLFKILPLLDELSVGHLQVKDLPKF